jgi:hypothetical protein
MVGRFANRIAALGLLRDDAVMRIHWGEWALPIRIKATFRPPDGE